MLILFQILQLDGTDASLRYLTKSGNLYQWLSDQDDYWQPVEDIICDVPFPNLANNRGQLVFEQEILDKVNNAALSLPGITTVYFK